MQYLIDKIVLNLEHELNIGTLSVSQGSVVLSYWSIEYFCICKVLWIIHTSKEWYLDASLSLDVSSVQ